MTDPALTKLEHKLRGYKTQQGYMRDDIAQLKLAAGDIPAIRKKIDNLQFIVSLFVVHFTFFYCTIAAALLYNFLMDYLWPLLIQILG